MKNILIRLLILVFVFLSAGTATLLAQRSDRYIIRDNEEYRDSLNAAFQDPEESPLLPDDFESFEGLSFYPVDPDFFIRTEFIRTPGQEPFKMATTSPDRNPWYEKYGEVHFSLNGKEVHLNIYQSHELRETEKYKNHLFLPFKDKTNGDETYGGGRYIELHKPKSDSITIDFNKAYNPYCAYNESYACPLVPFENHLQIPIKAGVKAFHTNKAGK